jgi:drug/metabolite transporter (DMT)-like permease
MVGVILVVRPPFLFGDASRAAYFGDAAGQVSYHAALLPAAVALTGAVFSAIAMMSLRTASIHETPEAVATHFSLMAFVVYAVAALVLADPPSLRALLPVVLAGVSAGGAQVAMTRSYGLEHAARVGGVGYLQVVVAGTLGAVVLHEPLTSRSLVGIALVVSSGVLLTVLSFADARRSTEGAEGAAPRG